MNNSRIEDTIQLLKSGETKKYTTHPFKKYQKLFIVLLTITAFVCVYMSYKNELTSRWTAMFQIETVRSNIEIMANNLDEMACHLPLLNPFDESVLPFDINPEPVNCENNHTLLFTTDLESNLIQVKNYTLSGYAYCCYQKFTRTAGSDKNIELDENCVPIRNVKTPIPTTIDFIIVSCRKDPSVFTPGYLISAKLPEVNLETSTQPPEDPERFTLKPVDMFGFVHLKSSVEQRILNHEKNMSEGKRKVNAVILGLDAVSHMNFQRIMPLTHDYIKKNLSGYGLSGYTKVGDNTFPNIVPALTGMFVEEISQGCWKEESDYFDDCPFIWKNFSSQGYRTVYGEDAVWMSSFNYQKYGFFNEPTDYYYNAFTYKIEESLGHEHLMNANLCYGPRIGFDVSLDYLKKMASTMNKTRRYFQFSWTTSMFHDYLEEGKLGDQILLETLQWFKNGGYFDDTVFILMSDHGIRWGDIRSTLQGRLEERMPFLYFILPEWFKEKYRPAVSNLLRNERRLTTPFDLYETLHDLLHLENIESPQKREYSLNDTLPRGISLFLPIPLNRTCQDAEIEEHFCVCQLKKTVEVENNRLVREAAESVVSSINKMFTKFPQCILLSLHQVLNAQVFQINSRDVDDSSDAIFDINDTRLTLQEVTFTMAFDVVPSLATFEATATRRTNGSWDVAGAISRTNVYGDQSICVSDYNLKKFCFCG